MRDVHNGMQRRLGLKWMATRPVVWIATTSNENFLRMRGWQQTIRDFIHQKEFVAGGLAGYAISEFQDAAKHVGDLDADWHEVEERVLCPFSGWTVLAESFKHIPQARPFCLSVRLN